MSKYAIIVSDNPWSFGDKLTMSATKRGAAANYNTLSTDELCALPVKDIIDPNGAILALWTPSSLLPDGLRVLDAFGFKLKTTYIWVKTKNQLSLTDEVVKLTSKYLRETGNEKLDFLRGLVKQETKKIISIGDSILSFGMGHLFRASHELCLIGTSNNKIYQQLQNRSQRSVCFAPNLKHSAKPENLQDALDIMFPPPADGTINRIELFGRRSKKNWLVVGNEAPETISLDIKVVLDNLIHDRPPNTPPQQHFRDNRFHYGTKSN
jgi:N6-adenosine-specific RNA methylase IME4